MCLRPTLDSKQQHWKSCFNLLTLFWKKKKKEEMNTPPDTQNLTNKQKTPNQTTCIKNLLIIFPKC